MSIVLLGSTSGSCTLQEQAIAGNTVLTLPTTSGTILTTGSSGGVIPKAALPSGSILQVVQATSSSSQDINTTSETAVTGMSASITPLSTSSRIFVSITLGEFRVPFGEGSQFKLYRNGGKIVDMINEAGYSGTLSSTARVGLTFNWSYVDSPSSTSALTYALYGKKLINLGGAGLQIMPNGSSLSSIILMEIAG